MTDDERWAAVAGRDEAADDRFVYAVVTTGVYCRPSCPSKRPRPENVRYFSTNDDAEADGFRACRRCRPREQSARQRRAGIVAEACRLLDGSDEPPDLEALAAAVGLSRFHLQRLFKAETGITPKAYSLARRADRVRLGLGTDVSVTSAIYDAGFGSNGRFYASSGARLGMTPTELRAGAPGHRVRFAVGECSLGAVLVAATDRGVCAIELGDDVEQLVRDLQDRFHAAELVGDDDAFAALVAQVVALVDDPEANVELPLDIRGTAFQQQVWAALRAVPPGTTVTYQELAARIGAPSAVRAVAGACAANRLAVAVPCHRVVRADGTPSGYRWGVERKQALLRREAEASAEAAPRSDGSA